MVQRAGAEMHVVLGVVLRQAGDAERAARFGRSPHTLGPAGRPGRVEHDAADARVVDIGVVLGGERVVPWLEAGDRAADREARAQPGRQLGDVPRGRDEPRVRDERLRLAVVDDVARLARP